MSIDKNKLFNLKSDPLKLGNIIGQNRSMQYIFVPLKGDQIILISNMDFLEEVVPYTISISFFGEKKVYSFLSMPNILKKGDILIQKSNSSMGIVTEVDTKASHATKYFEGSVVDTTPINYRNS